MYSEFFYGVVGQQGYLPAQSYSIQLAIEDAFQKCQSFICLQLGVPRPAYLLMKLIFTCLIRMQEILWETCS